MNNNEMISNIDEETMILAESIYNVDIYGMRDNDATLEEIANDIINNPRAVITYLLDIING
jgi:hypothetical protein